MPYQAKDLQQAFVAQGASDLAKLTMVSGGHLSNAESDEIIVNITDYFARNLYGATLIAVRPLISEREAQEGCAMVARWHELLNDTSTKATSIWQLPGTWFFRNPIKETKEKNDNAVYQPQLKISEKEAQEGCAMVARWHELLNNTSTKAASIWQLPGTWFFRNPIKETKEKKRMIMLSISLNLRNEINGVSTKLE